MPQLDDKVKLLQTMVQSLHKEVERMETVITELSKKNEAAKEKLKLSAAKIAELNRKVRGLSN